MKTIAVFCITLCILFSTATLAAPFNKSAKLIDGKSSMNISKDDDQTNINFAGSVGYFITDQIAIGANTAILYRSYKNYDYTHYGVGPQIHVFWEKTPDKVYPYVRSSLVYYGYSNRDDSDLAFQVAGGFSYMLNSAVALSPELYYLNNSSDGESETQFGINIGITGFWK